VREVIELIGKGKKIIFLHGVCGTGKSAIALNIARELGRTSIVVPVKALQRQYEEDYMGKKYVLKKNGRKMKIAMITGRDNHDSIIKPGVSCSDPFLPDTIRFTEKNAELIKEYYDENPFIKNKMDISDIRRLKRISIAPANPYWSPIINAERDLKQISDANKRKYKGLNGKEFIFYHRKKGCSYFDQYQAYMDADVLIFNSAKYKIECALDRKPFTDVEIIDEGDEFLDSFSTQEELDLTRLSNSLKVIVPDFDETEESIQGIQEFIKLEEKNKRALGVREDATFHINETKIGKILKMFLENSDLQAELSLDELNYGNHAVEVAESFDSLFDDTYLSYRYKDENLIVSLVSTNLSKQFKDIVDKNKAIVLMSGTIHSEEVLRNVFGLEDFAIVKAEIKLPGQVEIIRTGKEFDCKYANFNSGKHTREDYLFALESCIEKAKKPILIHVNAFEDLPSESEMDKLGLAGVMHRERLSELQADDKTGRMVSLFKKKLNECLFSTKCSRGVDFPGDICNSIIFTKYPNPNVKDIFWRVLEKTHPDIFWGFYKDKARREFLQRLYRAVRSKDDHVYVLSPDIRVLEAVRGLQIKNNNINLDQ
jgi:Rad3-related DNA helicase